MPVFGHAIDLLSLHCLPLILNVVREQARLVY